ncbi:Nostrin [Merluccius polli]|uniref:Nostrin n=1 Tax=Merluccius polli TaxID=89951 RepID=A0AA47N3A3_MERPO|nr:Nostrin [Merluccius polli]
MLSVASEGTRRRLLCERDLMLPSAVEICRLAELTVKCMRITEGPQAQTDSTTLKLDLLEATHYKLSLSLSELEGKPRSKHRFHDSISRWKDKDCEHSVIQLTRPVKMRRTSIRTRQSLRASIVYKGPVQTVKEQGVEPNPAEPDQGPPEPNPAAVLSSDPPSRDHDAQKGETGAEWSSIGQCKALYDFSTDQHDQLSLRVGEYLFNYVFVDLYNQLGSGDVVEIYRKEANGWWFGELGGRSGHFPSTYMEELPVLDV